MRYSLRPAVAGDSDWAYDLHRESLGVVVAQVFGPWDEDAQRRMHDAWFDPNLVRVIEVTGRPVGILEVREHPDHHYLARIEIASTHRAAGLGGAVLADLLRRADESAVLMRLDVFAVNRARFLYERLGFRQVGQNGSKVRMERLPRGRG